MIGNWLKLFPSIKGQCFRLWKVSFNKVPVLGAFSTLRSCLLVYRNRRANKRLERRRKLSETYQGDLCDLHFVKDVFRDHADMVETS